MRRDSQQSKMRRVIRYVGDCSARGQRFSKSLCIGCLFQGGVKRVVCVYSKRRQVYHNPIFIGLKHTSEKFLIAYLTILAMRTWQNPQTSTINFDGRICCTSICENCEHRGSRLAHLRFYEYVSHNFIRTFKGAKI